MYVLIFILLFHFLEETTLRGYKIPLGSVTLLNMYAANRNPKDFENPDEFNPSRYIATPEKSRAELPILFGVGKKGIILYLLFY